MGEMARPDGGDEYKRGDDMSRRTFIKTALTAAAVAAGAGALTGCESAEERSERRRQELLNAPVEKMEVVPWGGDVDADKINYPRTISELRDAAGWDFEYEREFEDVLRERYPDLVAENGTIQPGIYEVPVKELKDLHIYASAEEFPASR